MFCICTTHRSKVASHGFGFHHILHSTVWLNSPALCCGDEESKEPGKKTSFGLLLSLNLVVTHSQQCQGRRWRQQDKRMLSWHSLVTKCTSRSSCRDCPAPFGCIRVQTEVKSSEQETCGFVSTEKPVAHHVKLLGKNGNSIQFLTAVNCCTLLSLELPGQHHSF